MAPLALTLALLAMTVATVVIKVKPLDMAEHSFNDQYRGCSSAMAAALPALKFSEIHQNPMFAQGKKAESKLQVRGSPEFPLSPAQATAIMMNIYGLFNIFVHMARSSPQEYRNKFHITTLQFLLTQALATLNDAQKGQWCLEVYLEACDVWFEAQRGDTIRFPQFMPMSLSKPNSSCSMKTVFEVHTCRVMVKRVFSEDPGNWGVLIPPFETFQVTSITREGNKTQIQLRSTGTYSNNGGSILSAPFHLGGLLLATTTLAVATGIF